jgi:hypothetical protein
MTVQKNILSQCAGQKHVGRYLHSPTHLHLQCLGLRGIEEIRQGVC